MTSIAEAHPSSWHQCSAASCLLMKAQPGGCRVQNRLCAEDCNAQEVERADAVSSPVSREAITDWQQHLICVLQTAGPAVVTHQDHSKVAPRGDSWCMCQLVQKAPLLFTPLALHYCWHNAGAGQIRNILEIFMWQGASSCWLQNDPDIARRRGRQKKRDLHLLVQHLDCADSEAVMMTAPRYGDLRQLPVRKWCC